MCHVLVIEDECFTSAYIEMLALEAGATSVDVAACEDEAVELGLANRPTIILSDVRLESGTGPGAVERIRNAAGPIPTIFLTATPDACKTCDYADAILRKPVSAGALIGEIKRVAFGAG